MDKSFRSHAHYGTVCQILGQEQSSFVLTEQAPGYTSSRNNVFIQVKAQGIRRFRIDRIIERALDGLILTCETTVFFEQGSATDVKATQTSDYKQMKEQALELCKLSQQTQVTHRQQLYQQKEQQLSKLEESATQLTFFVVQLLATSFIKEEL